MNVQKKIKAKRYIVYALILLLAHLFQNSITIFPRVAGVRPALLISAAVCISMFEGEIVGALAGLFAGALWDTVTLSADGYNALYLMAACAVCGTLMRIFLRNNIVTYIMMNTAITMFYFVTYVVFFIITRGIDNAGALFLRYFLPMAAYSLILTPLWYWLIRAVNGKFSYEYAEY